MRQNGGMAPMDFPARISAVLPADGQSGVAMNPAGGLLIVWHSRTGGSRQLAECARQGALAALAELGREPANPGHDVVHPLAPDVRMLGAACATPGDLLCAGGYLFVCPENLASMSGLMKEFFDSCYYPVLGRIEGRPYAAIICAGSDGRSAAAQIERIATGWRLRRVADTLIVRTDAQTPEAISAPKTIGDADTAAAADLGGTLAGGLSIGIW